MILSVLRQVHDHVVAAVTRQYGLAEVPPFAIEVPPSRALGDLAVTVAFQLARVLRKAPRAIAQELVGVLGSIPGVAKIEAAPNGYLNLSLDRRAFLLARLGGPSSAIEPLGTQHEKSAGKTIVEHTAINPNKAAHIGHLRNAALGDTLARVLRFRNTPVEVQNYIDDLGVQVADIIVGYRDIERQTHDAVRLLLLGSVFEGHRVVRRPSGAARRARPDAARSRNRQQRRRRDRRIHRRSHRPYASGDDGAPEHRLRPADVRGRHPPSAVLGARVRDPEGAGRRVPSDRGKAGRLLGDADRGR
jgi:arginyl-tRNA synthetase